MPVPLIAAFRTCEGVKLGKGQCWINKLWRITDNSGRGYLVMPQELLWALWPERSISNETLFRMVT